MRSLKRSCVTLWSPFIWVCPKRFRKLSYAIGQRAGYINKIETGQSLPSLSGLYYICKYFGITPKEFFDDGQRAPEKLRHLMDELVQLSDAQLEAVTAVVENMRKP